MNLTPMLMMLYDILTLTPMLMMLYDILLPWLMNHT